MRLGAIPNSRTFDPFLDARHRVSDDQRTHLIHVIRMALRDQLLVETGADFAAAAGALGQSAG